MRDRDDLEKALRRMEERFGARRQTITTVFEDPLTGEWYEDRHAETVADPDPDALVIVMKSAVVMERDQAEAEGRTIIGPYESEDNPNADLVEVPDSKLDPNLDDGEVSG